jgi:endonuclease YncB( thermonuclease family)
VSLVAFLGIAVPASAQASVGPAYVTRVVDGDTLYAELGGRLEAVRYLGVNTPRIQHPTLGAEVYALAAREANRRMVEGRWIYLVFDGPERDRHGRILAYVWVDGTFVNAMLVHSGWGEAARASAARYAGYFHMLEDGARRDARGLWRDPAAQTYHRPWPTELAADSGEREEREDRSADVSGGRVFSAPAPFVPPSTPSGSLGPPAGPPPAPSVGSPPYVAPGPRIP